jgi:hypothetical protein
VTPRIPPTRGSMIRNFALSAAALAAAVSSAAAQDSTVVRADTAGQVTVRREVTYEVTAVQLPDAARGFEASPPLPEEHWAARAAMRAEMMGLAPAYFPAQRSVPRHVVAAALEEAVRSARGRPAMEALARGWWARFVEEFPEYGVAEPAGGVELLGRSLSGGYAEARGRLSPGIGYQGSEQPPRPIADESGLAAGGMGSVALGRHATLFLESSLVGDEAALARWDVSAGAGGWAFSAGRQEIGYGPARGGGIVLSPQQPFTRVELQTTRPFRLPWVLRFLGPMTVHTAVSRMDEGRHPTEPWFWTLRIAARPHPRFTLAGNRASIFGGEGKPVTAEKLVKLAIGVIRSDFENQVVSGDVRWRMPTEAVIPATVYLEWGADDGAGAIDEIPGFTTGVLFPAVPGVPQLALGAEYAQFGNACCGHGSWYHNTTFPGNWARGSQLLGHPLGGEGWEAAGIAQAELLDARLRVDARLFGRDYGVESAAVNRRGNLYAPVRVGRSTGGTLEAAYRVLRGADLRAGFRREDGDGWTEDGFHAEVAVFF